MDEVGKVVRSRGVEFCEEGGVWEDGGWERKICGCDDVMEVIFTLLVD